MQKVKLVVAGEKGSGKSSLIRTFADRDQFTKRDVLNAATIVHVMVDGKPFEVSVHDIHPDHAAIDYPDTNIFILCIDISNHESFVNNKYKQKYIDEMRKYTPEAPIIIIGTKSDLRWRMDYDDNLKLISMHDLKELCVKSGCLMYIELSVEYNESAEIQKILFDKILRKSIPRSRRRGNALTIPRYYSPKTEYHYDESQDSQPNITSARLLIYGFVHRYTLNDNINNSIFPKDLVILIGVFWMPTIEISYFENTVSGHLSMPVRSFGANKQLKRNYYIMFSMDLTVVILHNLAYYFFSIQLLLVKQMEIAAYIALSLTVLESLLIIMGYGLLFCHPRIKYYTYPMSIMQIMIELFVNFPLSLIQIIYLLFHIEDNSHPLIPSFYLSITMYILHGLYRYFMNAIYWAEKNKLLLEDLYGNCICWHGIIWYFAMLSFFIIGIIFTVRDSKNPVAIALIVISVILCCGLGFAWIPLVNNRRYRMKF